MSTTGVTLAALCGAVCLVWVFRHVTVSFLDRVGMRLGESHPDPPADAGRVSILLAAKDEEENIEPCLRGLLQQDYHDFEVIVINDRSSDATGDIVSRIAAEDARVKVLTVSELPDGWCGKNHAMHLGVQEATGQWLCTTDADCRHTSPRCVSVSVASAIEHESDLLSVLPTLRMEGFWENVVQPVCSTILVYWFQPKNVNNPKSGPAYANGTFMLFRRSAYDEIGGHEAVRDEPMEDLRMAERIKYSGRRLYVVQDHGLYNVRMYTSLSQIISGWSRIFWGAFTSRARVVLSMVVLAIASVLPYIIMPLAWACWAAGGDAGWLAAAVTSTMATVLQITLIGRLYALMRVRWQLCWTWPIGCVVALRILIRSYQLHAPGSALVWRGTAYTTDGPGLTDRS